MTETECKSQKNRDETAAATLKRYNKSCISSFKWHTFYMPVIYTGGKKRSISVVRTSNLSMQGRCLFK